MKQLLLSLLLFFVHFFAFSQTDYYWVGGSGDWTDYANHWATTSGGTTFHVQAPTSVDNVFFDANSFTATGQVLNIDAEANCADMDWTGVTNAPEVGSSLNILNIYGSLTIASDVTWNHRPIDFESTGTGNTITTGDIDFGNYTYLNFRGSGAWTLQDSLKIGNDIKLYSTASLDLNGQYVNARSIYLYSTSSIDLSSSEVVVWNFQNAGGGSTTITPGTSSIKVTNSFYPGGDTYAEVIFSGTIYHQNDGTIGTLIIEPGSEVEFESGATLTVADFQATGTKAEPIHLFTDTPASQVTISQSSGTVNADYLVMQDIAATGGAIFNADHTIDDGNNTGWTITALTGADYYWVGDTGDWSDYANHWATTSGGSTMHTDVPGSLDNVLFDANSFSATATVTLDINGNCADMNWTGVTEEVTFNNSDAEELSMYGSMTMVSTVTPLLDIIYFESGASETVTTGGSSFNSSKFFFRGTGDWALMDAVNVGNLEIQAGTLDLNDQTVDIVSRFDAGGSDSKTILLTSSTVYLRYFYATGTGLTLDEGTSTLYFDGTSGTMRANSADGNTFNNIVIDGYMTIDWSDHTFNSLELKPGSTLRVGNGKTITTGTFTANGTVADPITLVSSSAGSQGTLSVATGTIEASYLAIQDNVATGGATFNAYESTDNGNNTGWNFLADETAPSFESGYPVTNTIGGTDVTIDVQVDELSTIYWVALADGATTPTAAQVIAGTDASDVSAINGSASLTAIAETITFTIDGLSELTAYDFYFAVKDDAGNVQSTVETIGATTLDKSAPDFDSGYPVISFTGSTTSEFDVQVDEDGTIYYVVLADGASAPSSAQVKAGTDASDGAALVSGSFSVIASILKAEEIVGLSTETSYDLYVVSEDALSNLSTSPELLEFITTPAVRDFYWVGGTGNWSDFAAHWATASGGTTFYTEVPTAYDNVFFDANSFTATGQAVTIDAEANCAAMDWTGVVNSPQLASSSQTLNIYGSLTLSSEMAWNHLFTDFESVNAGNTITTGNVQLGSNTYMYFRGSGSWALQDSLKLGGEMHLYGGSSLDFNDQYVSAFSIYLYTSSMLDFSGSEINAVNFRDYGNGSSTLISGTSALTVTNSFHAGGNSFAEVIFSGTVYHQDDATIETLIIEEGGEIEFGAGATITTTDFQVAGTKAKPIHLFTDTPGTQVTISQSAGTVNGDYLVIQDIAATGGATFNADHTLDEGNNTGWNITALTGADYYWVGDTGNWSDFSNHWATTSGGTTMHTDVPGALDNVFFDANSFSAAATVTLDLNGNCADMDWTGVTEDVTFNTSASEDISIYGSMTMVSTVTPQLDIIYFESDASETVTTAEISFNSAKFFFRGSGDWTLMDALNVGNLEIDAGTLDFNDQMVDIVSRFDVGSSETKSILLTSSTIYLSYFYATNIGLTVDAGTSTLYFDGSSGRMRANSADGNTFNKVVVDGSSTFDLYDLTFASLELMPGSTLKIGDGETITTGSFTAGGTLANPINLISSTTGSQGTLSVASGTIEASYLAVQDNIATGGATFNAYESTDNGNNSGWNFLADETAPSFISGYPATNTIGGTDITVDVQVDELSTIYYVALANGATAPTAAQVVAGTDADDLEAINGSESLLSVEETIEITVTGLSEQESYDLYFAIADDADNIQSSVSLLSVTTIDASAPAFDTGYPKVSFLGSSTVSFDVSVDEAGTIYYVLLADGATAPSSAQVKAGTDASDAAALSNGSMVVTASTVSTEELVGLTTVTAYDLYLVSEDGSSNLSTAPELLEFTTTPEVRDFYWVGDTGYWSDYANHWATSSGGSTFYTEAPTQYDNVYFDVNSFSVDGAEVTIDATIDAYCRDIVWTGVTNSPSLTSEGSSNQGLIYVSGSITFVADMSVKLSKVYLTSDTEQSITSGNNGWGTTSSLILDGDGPFQLQDSLSIGWMRPTTGTLVTNDNPFYTYFFMDGGDGAISAGSSPLYSRLGVEFNDPNNLVGSGYTLTISACDRFNGGGNAFEDVVIESGTVTISDDNSFNSLTIGAGSSVSFAGGSTQQITSFIAEGSVDSFINLASSIGGTPATISSNGTVSVEFAELQDLTADGTATFEAVASVDNGTNAGWTFVKKDQLITFDALSDKVYGDASFELSAVSDAGLAITYDATGPASVLDNVLTLTGAGEVSVTASQVGNDYYNATEEIQGFTVAKASLTATADDQEITYGDALPAYTISYVGFVGQDDETVLTEQPVASSTATANSDAGDYAITVAGGSDSNYELTLVDGTLTIAKADQTITFDALSDVDIAQTTSVNLSATSTSGLDVSFELTSGDGSITDGVLTINNTGTFIVKASQAGSTNYNPATDVSRTFLVTDGSKSDQTITFTDDLSGLTYGDADVSLTAVSSSSLEISYTTTGPISVSGSSLSIAGAGAASVTANQGGDDSFNPATSVTIDFTISTASLTATADDQAISYGDALPAYTISYVGFVGQDDETGLTEQPVASSNATANSDAGDYAITVAGGSDSNYELTLVDGTLTIAKADQTITFDPLDDLDIAQTTTVDLTATSTSGLDVSFELTSGDGSITDGVLTINNTGTFIVRASQAGNTNYNAAADVSRTFLVTNSSKSDQTITFTDNLSGLTYGDGDVTLTATASSSLAVSYTTSGPVSVDGSTLIITGGGAASVTANQGGDDSFNPAASVTIDFTIAKASLTATADDLAITYGDAIPDFALTYDGFIGNDDASVIDTAPTGETTATAQSDAGTYDITVSGGADDSYDFTYAGGILTINKADQEITFDAISSIDIASANSVNLVASASSGLEIAFTLVSGDGTISGNTLTVNNSGNFSVKASQAGDNNYNAAADVTQAFVVTDSRKTDQTITFDAIADQEYGNEINLSATASSDLNVTYELIAGLGTITDGALTITDVGQYTVRASQDGDDSFNPATSVDQSFTVSKAVLAMVADNQTMTEGAELPTLTYTLAGFKLDDTETDLDELPEIATTATSSSAEGDYPITLAGGSDNHYSFDLTNGTLTIEGALGLQDQGLKIYPIPTQGEVTIQIDEPGGKLSIYNLDGRKLLQVAPNSRALKLSLDDLTDGLYLIKYESRSGTKTQRLLIQR